MKKLLLIIVCSLFFTSEAFSQTDKAWGSVKSNDFTVAKTASRESFPVNFKLMQLNMAQLKNSLMTAPDRNSGDYSDVIISIPNVNGELENFRMYEASNFDADLQAQYPNIRSYVGIGIDDPYATLRLSLDPSGIQTMVFRANRPTEFMEPYSDDKAVYAVYSSSRTKGKLPFTCSTPEQVLVNDISTPEITSRSSSGTLLNFRLALSCNGEYANYFGATSSAQSGLVLAAFNATMTRVNGVFEKDFAIHMNIVAQTTNVIYYNPVTDPYTTMASWNTQLQQALNTTLTGPSTSLAANNAAYDVGHMFGASGGGGNAGCIGCVCVNGTASGTGSTKGRGITSPADGVPMGDSFDIDYVAHELGHQFGANHTFSHSSEGTGVNKEVGGGVTIMGYAGITSYNTHMNSIDVFHSASIAQVQTNMVGKTCPTSSPITHGTPVVNAGGDYTIPRSTPFMLTGSATDAGGTGLMTYTWEQNDDAGANTGANSVASATKTVGPNFVCYPDTSSPTRYFPTMTSVMNGSTTTQGVDVTMEALSSVARTLNFRLTARDNVAGQGQTNYDDMIVTVDATRGPLLVTSQNVDGIVWTPGTTETVTWAVNNTNTSSGGNNVDILYTTDGGATWNTILTNTLNDGSQDITVPSVSAPNCRIMVKASGNIFFNVNTKNIAIGDYIYQSQNVCTDYTFNLNAAITESTTSYSGFSLPISDSFTITDVNVVVDATHPNIGTTQFAISSPSGYAVTPTPVLSRVYRASVGCPGGVNLNKFFDMSGAALNCSNTIDGAATIPADDISTVYYNGTNSAGSWYIWFVDLNTTDGLTGTINYVTFNLCRSELVPVLTNESFETNDFVIYPNPNNGTFNIQLTANTNEVALSVHDLRGRLILSKDLQASGLVNEQISLADAQTGIYLVTIQDGSRKITMKIIVE